jgi:hypothetical protein
MKEGDHVEDLSVDGRIILQLILKEQDGSVWTGFVWFMVGNSGGIVYTVVRPWVP